MNPTEALTGKLGPLPAWAWGLLAGGAIIVVRKLRGGSSGGAVNSQPGPYSGSAGDDADLAAVQLPSSYTVPGGGSSGSGSGSAGIPQPAALPSYADNNAWQVAAVNALAARQFSPAAVSGALGSWLSGDSLSSDQLRIVDAAIIAVGAPPSPAPAPVGGSSGGIPQPAPAAPAPAAPAGPTAPSWLAIGQLVRVDDSPWSGYVAVRTADGLRWLSEPEWERMGRPDRASMPALSWSVVSQFPNTTPVLTDGRTVNPNPAYVRT
jgi:hypothetical protein